MPQSFLTDDQLYEQGRVGIEEEPIEESTDGDEAPIEPSTRLSTIKAAFAVALVAIVAAITRGMDLVTRLASVSVVIIAMLVTVVPRVPRTAPR